MGWLLVPELPPGGARGRIHGGTAARPETGAGAGWPGTRRARIRRRSCVGWCQFGPTEELPRIKYQKAYRQGLHELPDWRITCFFVGRTHRHLGVAGIALAGGLAEIARLGGGSVESYPEDTSDRKVSGSFLHNGTVAMFERHGFTRSHQIGKRRWVVSRLIP